MRAQTDEHGPEPLHVWYASNLFLTAMDLGILAFSLRRTAAGLVVATPEHGSGDLGSFVRCAPCRDRSGNDERAVPADRVWRRLLTMAGMRDARVSTGTIRIDTQVHYPYTEWTVQAKRRSSTRLDLTLTLERVILAVPAPARSATPRLGSKASGDSRRSHRRPPK